VQATLAAGGPMAGPAKVAWVVVRAAQGRGYAREAALSLVAVLQAAGWTVVAYIHPARLASQRVAPTRMAQNWAFRARRLVRQ